MSADGVRLALPGEASAIAAIQRRSWEQTLPPALALQLLRSIDLEAMTVSWLRAIMSPPLAEFRVLVAVQDDRIAGFAAVGPSDDEDAEVGVDALVAEFAIDPQAQRRGHGSRLLNAIADTLRSDGFAAASWWVPTTNDALRRFVTSSGWAADGAHRVMEVQDGEGTLKVVRLRTSLV